MVEPTKPHECGCIDGNDGNITRYDGTDFNIPFSLPLMSCCPLNATCTADKLPCSTIIWEDNTTWVVDNDITSTTVDETWPNANTITSGTGDCCDSTNTFTDEFLTGLPLADLDHLKIGGCFGPHHALRDTVKEDD